MSEHYFGVMGQPMPDPDQTPEARLAAALQGTHGQLNGSYVDVARRILAADPTLAADLALAAAVRRLPNENLSIRHCPTDDEYEWCVAINAKGYKVGCGTTLTAAIEEALDDID